MKRALAIALFLALLAGIYGPVSARADEPMVITVFRGKTGRQPAVGNKIYRMIEQELGVRFEFKFLQPGEDLNTRLCKL